MYIGPTARWGHHTTTSSARVWVAGLAESGLPAAKITGQASDVVQIFRNTLDYVTDAVGLTTIGRVLCVWLWQYGD